MRGRNWTCPFCNRPQTATDGQVHYSHEHISLRSHRFESVGLSIHAQACSNPDCGEVTLTVSFVQDEYQNAKGYVPNKLLESFDLRPQGASKPQPACVPSAIADDYYEACKIRNLSPKASATLARRCLQGMIRDFCGISKSRLVDEIEALGAAVAAGTGPHGVLSDTIEAIDHVRGIGNIGAHMEKDVNVIIPVEPGESQALIELIELLFEEWYVAREDRQKKLERVKQIGAEKQAMKKAAPKSAT